MRKKPDKQLETRSKQLSDHYGDIGIKAVAAAVEPRWPKEEDQERISSERISSERISSERISSERISSKEGRSALDRHKAKNE